MLPCNYYHHSHNKFPCVARNLLISEQFTMSPDVASRNKTLPSFRVIGIWMSKEKEVEPYGLGAGRNFVCNTCQDVRLNTIWDDKLPAGFLERMSCAIFTLPEWKVRKFIFMYLISRYFMCNSCLKISELKSTRGKSFFFLKMLLIICISTAHRL